MGPRLASAAPAVARFCTLPCRCEPPDAISMNLSLTLHTIAQRMPDRPAVSWEEGSLSYAALESEVQRIAGALLGRHGLQPGARVALAMENCAEFLPALY